LKPIIIAIACLTVMCLLALAQLPNSPFADDRVFMPLFFDSEPPTFTIQQCDGFSQVTDESIQVRRSSHLTDIQIVQSPEPPLDPANFRAFMLMIHWYSALPTGAAVSWLTLAYFV
jgi:hypothetical protein